jgi:hypothetical protein
MMLAITSADFNERVLQAELNAHADCLLQQVAAVKKYPVFGQTLISLLMNLRKVKGAVVD